MGTSAGINAVQRCMTGAPGRRRTSADAFRQPARLAQDLARSVSFSNELQTIAEREGLERPLWGRHEALKVAG
jgi:hypothetical protein